MTWPKTVNAGDSLHLKWMDWTVILKVPEDRYFLFPTDWDALMTVYHHPEWFTGDVFPMLTVLTKRKLDFETAPVVLYSSGHIQDVPEDVSREVRHQVSQGGAYTPDDLGDGSP